MKRMRDLGVSMLALLALLGIASAQKWTPLKHPGGYTGVGAMLLLTDGRVLMHDEGTNILDWYTLTPDKTGSYINGPVKKVASMPSDYAPLYFGSVVLPDGRVTVEGGEYLCLPNCNAVWTNLGAIYDPV